MRDEGGLRCRCEPTVVDHGHEVLEASAIHIVYLSVLQEISIFISRWAGLTIDGVDTLDELRPVGWHRLLVEPRRPEAIRRRPNAFWLAVAAVCIGAFMGQLDASIVTVALPTLQRTFHASVGAVTWVGLSYLLVLVATVAAVGRFADMWGHKLLYVYGFGIFIVGSALCGLAPNLGMLIGFRALQAVGAALLQANSVAIIVLAVPKSSLGKAIGIQGAAQAARTGARPDGRRLSPGGRGLAAHLLRQRALRAGRHDRRVVARSPEPTPQARVRFDWAGLALFFPAVVALFSAVSLVTRRDGPRPSILGLSWSEVPPWPRPSSGAKPDAASRCWTSGCSGRSRFSAGIASGMLSYLVMFGVLFLVPSILSVVCSSVRAGPGSN